MKIDLQKDEICKKKFLKPRTLKQITTTLECNR